MIRKIQCFVMALCLLLTAAFGLGSTNDGICGGNG